MIEWQCSPFNSVLSCAMSGILTTSYKSLPAAKALHKLLFTMLEAINNDAPQSLLVCLSMRASPYVSLRLRRGTVKEAANLQVPATVAPRQGRSRTDVKICERLLAKSRQSKVASKHLGSLTANTGLLGLGAAAHLFPAPQAALRHSKRLEGQLYLWPGRSLTEGSSNSFQSR